MCKCLDLRRYIARKYVYASHASFPDSNDIYNIAIHIYIPSIILARIQKMVQTFLRFDSKFDSLCWRRSRVISKDVDIIVHEIIILNLIRQRSAKRAKFFNSAASYFCQQKDAATMTEKINKTNQELVVLRGILAWMDHVTCSMSTRK